MTAHAHDETDRQRTTSDETHQTDRSPTQRARRLLSAVLGGALLVRGLRRRSLRGLVTALVGGWLLIRTLGGRSRNRVGRDVAAETVDSHPGQATTVTRSVVVERSAAECYEVWRDPEQFSQVMGHIADVAATDDDHLRWTVEGPGGRDLSWDTRVVEDDPGQIIRWETDPDALVSTDGVVRFRETEDADTEVTLALTLDPPGGSLGTAVLHRLDVVPDAVAGTTLDRFKTLVETGESPSRSETFSNHDVRDSL